MSPHHPKLSFVTTFLAVMFLIGGSLGFPGKAEAQASIVHDPINLVQNAISATKNIVTAAATGSLNTKEYVLDPLAYQVAQVARNSITKGVVNWINSGFDGSPSFVTDLNSTLLEVGDTYAANFLNQLSSNSAIRSPFQDQVAQSVRSNYYLSTSRDGFFLQNPYTLNQVSPDDAAFLRGDFTQGGWNAWLSTFQNPANNPFGASLLQQERLGQVVQNAVDNQETELGWSGGTKSYRGTNCGVSTGNTRVDLTNLGGTAKSVALSTVNNCLFNTIQTSGALISNAANQYLVNSGLNSYISADEMDEVVNALMGQLVNKALGPGGVLGVTRPSSGGGRSYIDTASDPSQNTTSSSPAASTSLTSAFLTTLGNQVIQIQAYQANWQTINDAALAAKTALQGSTCFSGAAAAITNQVDPVVTQSAAALAGANTALTALEKIRVGLTTAVSTNTTDQTAAVTQATSDYQALLAGTSMPSVADMTYAQEQSADSLDASTLHAKMVQLTAQAKCGT